MLDEVCLDGFFTSLDNWNFGLNLKDPVPDC